LEGHLKKRGWKRFNIMETFLKEDEPVPLRCMRHLSNNSPSTLKFKVRVSPNFELSKKIFK